MTIFRVMKMFSILVTVVVTQLCVIVKIYQIYFIWVNFITGSCINKSGTITKIKISSAAGPTLSTMNILALCWDLFFLTCTAEKPRDRHI